jgi:hypothetical protein
MRFPCQKLKITKKKWLFFTTLSFTLSFGGGLAVFCAIPHTQASKSAFSIFHLIF